jgi:hypothetical protein
MAEQENARVSSQRGRLACSTPRPRTNHDLPPARSRALHRRGSFSSPEHPPPARCPLIANALPSPSQQARVSWERGRLACCTPRPRTNPDSSPARNRALRWRGSASSPEHPPPARCPRIATDHPSSCQQGRVSWERGRLACCTPRPRINPDLSQAPNRALHRRGSPGSPEHQPRAQCPALQPFSPAHASKPAFPGSAGVSPAALPGHAPTTTYPRPPTGLPTGGGAPAPPNTHRLRHPPTSQTLSPAHASKPAFPGSAGVSPAALPGHAPIPTYPRHATGLSTGGGAPAPPNTHRLRHTPTSQTHSPAPASKPAFPGSTGVSPAALPGHAPIPTYPRHATGLPTDGGAPAPPNTHRLRHTPASQTLSPADEEVAYAQRNVGTTGLGGSEPFATHCIH